MSCYKENKNASKTESSAYHSPIPKLMLPFLYFQQQHTITLACSLQQLPCKLDLVPEPCRYSIDKSEGNGMLEKRDIMNNFPINRMRPSEVMGLHGCGIHKFRDTQKRCITFTSQSDSLVWKVSRPCFKCFDAVLCKLAFSKKGALTRFSGFQRLFRISEIKHKLLIFTEKSLTTTKIAF